MAKRSVKPASSSGRGAASSGGGRRRSIVAIILVGFVLVATGVIARRVYGVSQSTRLRNLERQLDALRAERIRVDAEVRDASSRSRLQAIAEQRLNMHIALPEQQVFLTKPPHPIAAHDSF